MSDIMRWIPDRWEDIVGNHKLVQEFRHQLRAVRVDDNNCRPATAITGPSRSGKTSTIKFFARCLFCQDLNPKTLNPCNYSCPICRDNEAMKDLLKGNGVSGLFSYDIGVNCHFIQLDCTKLTPALLRSELTELNSYQGIRVVLFDEAHRLDKEALTDLLLKEMEQKEAFWIASAITLDAQDAFLNRFSAKLSTQLPQTTELVAWLAARCRAWGIEVDSPRTLILLARRAQHTPGQALQVLSRASIRSPSRLTSELVEEHAFNL